MTRFYCDRQCVFCVLREICDGVGKVGYYCPFLGCNLSRRVVGKIADCWICGSRFVLLDMSRREVKDLLDFIGEVEALSVRDVSLPKVVPIISISDSETHCWRWTNVEAVIVSFEEIYSRDLFDEILSRGIHSYLDFDGKVLLSSIMLDELLLDDEVFEKFIKIAKQGGFDAVIGWDVPVYLDIPLYYSWINLLMGLQLTYKLCLEDLAVIGLLKGNTPKQISFSVNSLERMSVKSVALHASEYLVNFKFDPWARNIIYRYADEIQGKFKSLLVIGALRPSSIKFIREVFHRVKNLSIGGFSYYLDAERFTLYLDEREVNVSGKFLKCNCPACENIRTRDLLENVGFRASHNLSQVKSMLNGGNAYSYELYDLVIEKGESAVLISDIHIWTPQSLLEELLDFLEDLEPTHIIFLGDVFDLRWGSPELYQTTMFFKTLRKLKSYIFTVKGCCDSSDKNLLRAMDKLALQNTHTSNIYRIERDVKEKLLEENLLNLYRFHRTAKEKLVIKLPDNQIIQIQHGHKIVENPKTNMKQVIKTLRQYKSTVEADWLIIGHIHRAFIDHENGIASTGCWQLPPTHLLGTISKKDLKTAIIITPRGKIKLIQ